MAHGKKEIPPRVDSRFDEKASLVTLADQVARHEVRWEYLKLILAGSGISLTLFVGAIIYLITEFNSLDLQIKKAQGIVQNITEDINSNKSQIKSAQDDLKSLNGSISNSAKIAVKVAIDDPHGEFQLNIERFRKSQNIVPIKSSEECPDKKWVKVKAIWIVLNADRSKLQNIDNKSIESWDNTPWWGNSDWGAMIHWVCLAPG